MSKTIEQLVDLLHRKEDQIDRLRHDIAILSNSGIFGNDQQEEEEDKLSNVIHDLIIALKSPSFDSKLKDFRRDNKTK